eukprot:SAG11_NODE_5043_length_1681_cov_3.587231_1_plen_252_part_00
MSRVAVVGAGGIGGWLGAHLASSSLSALVEQVVFVGRANSAHTTAMQVTGLQLIEPDKTTTIAAKDLTVVLPGSTEFEAVLPVDLAIVCVKTWQVETAVEAVLPMLKPDGCIMTTQNGVDAPAVAAAAVGMERVVASICRVGALVERAGVVSKSAAFTGGSLEIGALHTGGHERVDQLCELFRGVGVACTASADIKAAMWTKLASISAFGVRSNPMFACALRSQQDHHAALACFGSAQWRIHRARCRRSAR